MHKLWFRRIPKLRILRQSNNRKNYTRQHPSRCLNRLRRWLELTFLWRPSQFDFISKEPRHMKTSSIRYTTTGKVIEILVGWCCWGIFIRALKIKEEEKMISSCSLLFYFRCRFWLWLISFDTLDSGIYWKYFQSLNTFKSCRFSSDLLGHHPRTDPSKTEVSSSLRRYKKAHKERYINTFLISCYGWVGFFWMVFQLAWYTDTLRPRAARFVLSWFLFHHTFFTTHLRNLFFWFDFGISVFSGVKFWLWVLWWKRFCRLERNSGEEFH